MGWSGRPRPEKGRNVPELGKDEPLHRQTNGGGRTGEGENRGPSTSAGDGAGEHGGWADLVEAKHAKQLAETVQAFVEQTADGFVGRVARRQTRPTAEDHDVACVGVAKSQRSITYAAGFVGKDLIRNGGMSGGAEQLPDQCAAGVGIRGTRIADGDDGAANTGNSLGVMVGSGHRGHCRLSIVDWATRPAEVAPPDRHTRLTERFEPSFGPHLIDSLPGFWVALDELDEVGGGDAQKGGGVANS